MTQDELKMVLEALKWCHGGEPCGTAEAIAVVEKALAQPEQELVAWLLPDKNINSLQVDSIQRLINRLKHAHHTDLCVRINGQDEWFQADWLKHMARATPPQRTEPVIDKSAAIRIATALGWTPPRPWVGLTDEEISEVLGSDIHDEPSGELRFIRAIEAKLKEKNT